MGRITIRLDDDMEKKLKTSAEKAGLTLSDYVRQRLNDDSYQQAVSPFHVRHL